MRPYGSHGSISIGTLRLKFHNLFHEKVDYCTNNAIFVP